MPGQFSYYIYRDAGATGRLECTVYKGQHDDKGEGVLVWSKAESKKFIRQDYPTFLSLVQDASQ